MQAGRVVIIGAALLFATAAQAALYKWVDQHGVTRYGDRPPPGAEAQQMKEPPAAAAADAPADPDAEAKEQIREELLKKEQARLEQRRQNCERARSELARISDVPARNIMRTDEAGNITRATEEEHQAAIADWRRVETENCG